MRAGRVVGPIHDSVEIKRLQGKVVGAVHAGCGSRTPFRLQGPCPNALAMAPL